MAEGAHMVTVPGQFDRRSQLMLDVTYHTLQSDPDLRLCEGLRLIEAARSAVARLEPASLETMEIRVVPMLRQVLLERFGVSDPCCPGSLN